MPPIPFLSNKTVVCPSATLPLVLQDSNIPLNLLILIDRFVKKVYELDPSTTGIPWQPRGYTSKRKNVESYSAETIPKKICTPLMDKEVGESGLVVPRQ